MKTVKTVKTGGIEIAVNESELIALKNLKMGQEKNPHFSGRTALQNTITKVKSSLYPGQELYLAEAWGDIRVKAFHCLSSVDDKQQPGHHVYFKTADEAVLYHHCVRTILENGVSIMDSMPQQASGQTIGALIDSLQNEYFSFTPPNMLASIEQLDGAQRSLNNFLAYLRKIKLVNMHIENSGFKIPRIGVQVEFSGDERYALKIKRDACKIYIYASSSHFEHFNMQFTLDSIKAKVYNMLKLITDIKALRGKIA